jgi:hypothetical protein
VKPKKHLIPKGDIKPHITLMGCHCHPLLNKDGNAVHNAFDTREKYERQGYKTKGWLILNDNEPIEDRPAF